MGDHYSVLGVQASASQSDIKASFRKLALQHHPDRHLNSGKQQQVDAEARFKAINEAYKVLGDEQKRRQYDMRHSAWHPGAGSQGAGAHSSVNRDWSRSHYQHNAQEHVYTSRLGWWQQVGRLFRHRARSTEAAAQGLMLLLLGGGLAFAAAGSDAFWEYKNRGKRFKDIPGRQRD